MTDVSSWTPRGKKVAKLISYGIMIAIVITLVGAIWSGIEVAIGVSGSATNFISWFLEQYWTYQVLIVGGLILGLFFGIIGFQIFIKKGQRFILKHIFKLDPTEV